MDAYAHMTLLGLESLVNDTRHRIILAKKAGDVAALVELEARKKLLQQTLNARNEHEVE